MNDKQSLLESKHNAMATLLGELRPGYSATPERTTEDWEHRYTWLLRSSLEALGQPVTPWGARTAEPNGKAGKAGEPK